MTDMEWLLVGLTAGFVIRPFSDILSVILKNAWQNYIQSKNK